MEVGSVVGFLLMTLITWYAVTTQSQRGQLLPTDLTATLLVGTLVPAMAILVLLGRRLALQRAAENAGGGGQLHVRLVFFFSLISAIPTLLVVIFASWLFQYGVEFWFSDSSRGLLENSNKLARGYSEQTLRDVGYESVAMATDSRTMLAAYPVASREFQAFLADQVLRRNLRVAAKPTMTIRRVGADRFGRTLALMEAEGKDLSCHQLENAAAIYNPKWDTGGYVFALCGEAATRRSLTR